MGFTLRASGCALACARAASPSDRVCGPLRPVVDPLSRDSACWADICAAAAVAHAQRSRLQLRQLQPERRGSCVGTEWPIGSLRCFADSFSVVLRGFRRGCSATGPRCTATIFTKSRACSRWPPWCLWCSRFGGARLCSFARLRVAAFLLFGGALKFILIQIKYISCDF